MATKKKKKTPSRAFKPAESPAPTVALSPQSSFTGFLMVLVFAGIFVLAWLGLRGCAPKEAAPAPAPVSAAPAAAPANAPQARSIATPSAPKPAAAKPQASAHREAAGAETGAPSLTLDRSSAKSLSLQCWRPADGQATLDVFAPRNRVIANLKSASGAAGWVDLSWDGRDAHGKKVPQGLYFLRPSQRGDETVKDVWVKD